MSSEKPEQQQDAKPEAMHPEARGHAPLFPCSASDAEAVAGLQTLAEENGGQWEVELQASSRGGEREDAVAEG